MRWRSGVRAAAAEDPLGSVADEVLLARIADGDSAALAALYRRYAERLFGFCFGMPATGWWPRRSCRTRCWRCGVRPIGTPAAPGCGPGCSGWRGGRRTT